MVYSPVEPPRTRELILPLQSDEPPDGCDAKVRV